MTKLAIYLLCVGLVVMGAFGFIGALKIEGRLRTLLACLMASVPIAAGIFLFHSAGLRPGDLRHLVRTASEQMKQISADIQDSAETRGKLYKLMQ